MRKPRILFVDDEELVLDAMNRSTRQMRHEWDIDFANSGSAALRMMSEATFDVLVTDLSMPEMSGVELLAKVKERHPSVVRIVLSGDPDQDNPHKVAESAHQYLTKPCSSEVLHLTVQQAVARRAELGNANLKALVSKLGKLPSIPALYQKIMVQLQQPDTTLASIGEIISKDMAMTTKLLQMVNSPFFGLTAKVSNPAHACRLLGLETIKALVLTSKIFSSFDDCPACLDVKMLWQHSLSVGIFAKTIAQDAGIDLESRDAAFTAGLLHDIGKLILGKHLPTEYARATLLREQEGQSLADAERTVFNSSHAEVGAYLIDLWGLPQQIGEGIANHHQPERQSDTILSTSLVVHIANWMSHDLAGETDAASQLNDDYVLALGLQDRIANWKATCEQKNQHELLL